MEKATVFSSEQIYLGIGSVVIGSVRFVDHVNSRVMSGPADERNSFSRLLKNIREFGDWVTGFLE